jgi:hypothetical protein
MKHPLTRLTSQHLGAGQSILIYLSLGYSLYVQQGQACIEQAAWVAERMLIKRTDLRSEQVYICEASGWVKLTGSTKLDFVVIEHTHAARVGWRFFFSRLLPNSLRWLASSAP